MNPFRIIILGILIYFLIKLVFGKKISLKKKQAAETEGKQSIQDVLVEDPVCHTFVPKGQAQPLLLEGEKYYFCSDECRKKFIKLKEPNQ